MLAHTVEALDILLIVWDVHDSFACLLSLVELFQPLPFHKNWIIGHLSL